MSALYVIIPAYNEEETIESVAREWHDVVRKTGSDSRLVIIDDGGTDATYKKLRELKKELPQLKAITKPNSGHGGTVLFGYHYGVRHGAEYVFQTDSDGQTVAEEFWELWDHREDYDIQIGYRKGREDGFSRVVVTKVLKGVLFIIFHIGVTDANAPFRLMSGDSLKEHLGKIPKNFNLSNVLLSVLYEKSNARIRYVPITFRPRQGGVNSINLKRIMKIGWKALRDFTRLSKKMG